MNQRKFDVIDILTLIIANGLVVWQFVFNNGSVLDVLWIYWTQSIIIGAVNVVRMLTITKLEDNPILNAETPFPSTSLKAARIIMASFFVIHYGMFHFAYASFLGSFGNFSRLSMGIGSNGDIIKTATNSLQNEVSALTILVAGAIFLIHHLISFAIEYRTVKNDPGNAPDLKATMFKPYARIIPMHIIIIIAPIISSLFGGNNTVMVVFIVLKTIVDIRMSRSGVSLISSRYKPILSVKN